MRLETSGGKGAGVLTDTCDVLGKVVGEFYRSVECTAAQVLVVVEIELSDPKAPLPDRGRVEEVVVVGDDTAFRVWRSRGSGVRS